MRKGQFRKHLKKQRCAIPAEGFYEWRDERGKQPYYFSRKDGKPLMLAGIWEIAEYKGDSRIAFAILTDEPNELVASYHDRMPLALADDKSWHGLTSPMSHRSTRICCLTLVNSRCGRWAAP
jgi:putative SOS response-associated peptidase YedK